MAVKLILAAIALTALYGASFGQEACPPGNTWTFAPQENDAVSFKFVGRTLSAAGTQTVVLRTKTQADASPSGMITAASVSGDTYSLRIAPDTGCGTAGCRAGNQYQITVQPTDSGTNQPIGIACVVIKKTVWKAQP